MATLNVTYLSGLLAGQTANVSVTEAEILVETGVAKLTAPGEPAADPDPVFINTPALDK